MQTAKPLSKVSKLEAQPLEDMVEQDFGQWDGLTEAQMRERDSALVDQWRAAPQDVALPAGENITQVAERAKRVLKHIRSSDPDGVSCAVGHKTFNRVLISLLEELPLESYRRSVPQPVGAINIIEWDGRDAARVRGVGLTGHFG